MIKEQSEGDESEEADRDKVFRTLLAMASRPDSVPCPHGSVGAVSCTKRLSVQFLVRAHAWVAGSIPA